MKNNHAEMDACTTACNLLFHTKNQQSASQAQAYSQLFGANLVSVTDINENTCIFNELNKIPGAFPVWIGLSDLVVEGSFQWYDQATVSFTNWGINEPDNASGNENCVQLTATGKWEDKNCDIALSASIMEVNLCPQTVITTKQNKICQGENSVLNATTYSGSKPFSYLWISGSDTLADSLAGILVSPDQTSTYTVISTDRYGCESSASIIIKVFPAPEVNFSATVDCSNGNVEFTDNTSISSGKLVAWEWNLGDGNDSIFLQNLTHNYANGDYSVSLDVSSDSNCTATFSKKISVTSLPVANFSSNTSVCVYDTIRLEDNSTAPVGSAISEWNWNLGDGHTRNLQHVNYIFADSGIYEILLVVTLENGCRDSVKKPVQVFSAPLSEITTNRYAGCTPFCPVFRSIPIKNDSIASIVWILSGDTLNAGNEISYCFDKIGKNDIQTIITSEKGCSDTVLKDDFILVYDVPISQFAISPGGADILNPFIACTDLSIDSKTWRWDFGDSERSTEQFPAHIYRDTGTFEITQIVENEFGCKDTSSLEVSITPRHLFYVSNAFTPDGDFVNDVFVPKGLKTDYESYSFIIYNKWGEKVFYTEAINEGWDGKISSTGNEAPEGIYTYKIHIIQFEDFQYKYNGQIALYR